MVIYPLIFMHLSIAKKIWRFKKVYKSSAKQTIVNQIQRQILFWAINQCILFFLTMQAFLHFVLGDLVGLVTPPLFAQSIKGHRGHEEDKLG